MLSYLLRRLLLLPITLFFIIFVNFVIINLAPGDPVTVTQLSAEGNATRRADKSMAFGSDERYLQFREHYGLTLPILFNTWPWITQQDVDETLHILLTRKWNPTDTKEIPIKEYEALRIEFGDQARFTMPKLLNVFEDPQQPMTIRSMASRFFARGGTKQAFLGTNLTADQAAFNKKISADNTLLRDSIILQTDAPEVVQKKVDTLVKWYHDNKDYYDFEPTAWQKVRILFFENRFYRYMERIITLDFGTMRNDNNKTVISEVTRRFKYSLTLAILPMVITFIACMVLGLLMAYWQNTWPDYGMNLIFLVFYALPVFVVAPFLIEFIALNRHFPFTDIPIPISGFTSPDRIYDNLNSYQRLIDILTHIFLPLVAIIYGSLAAEARLSRTAVLEVLRQDYIRTAWAKGLRKRVILFKHVGRNAGITIVTSVASSLGIVLGGSLIVETLFNINGFGKFFYDAVVNRDYNVIMFSSIAGSFLSLMGYLAADIAYTVLDPRVTLE